MISNASPVIEARQFGCILVPPIVALNAAELPDKANASILFAAFWTLSDSMRQWKIGTSFNFLQKICRHSADALPACIHDVKDPNLIRLVARRVAGIAPAGKHCAQGIFPQFEIFVKRSSIAQGPKRSWFGRFQGRQARCCN